MRATKLGKELGIEYKAELMPEDKIAIVQQYQDQGRIVVMIGDCVNDAPALMQTDVGIAMGAVGTDMAIEAAHTALMREDWNLVLTLLCIAPRSMSVVKMNFGFTLRHNLTGIALTAAAQSIPDLGIFANPSRLLYQE